MFEIIQTIIIVFVSISFHEFAHAWVSYKLGDPTPNIQGRVTLNPLAHVDPLGGILILFVILSGYGIGRGKPVEINPYNYKNPVKGELMVALAGPAMNILLGIIFVAIFLVYGAISGYSLDQTHFYSIYHLLDKSTIDVNVLANIDYFVAFFGLFAITNFGLAVFNLIPIRPLDSFSILKTYWYKLAYKMMEYKQYISIIVLILLLGPTRNVFGSILGHISMGIFGWVMWALQSLFYYL